MKNAELLGDWLKPQIIWENGIQLQACPTRKKKSSIRRDKSRSPCLPLLSWAVTTIESKLTMAFNFGAAQQEKKIIPQSDVPSPRSTFSPDRRFHRDAELCSDCLEPQTKMVMRFFQFSCALIAQKKFKDGLSCVAYIDGCPFLWYTVSPMTRRSNIILMMKEE
jgi:hypothetical protein